jgi:hypothetical protein
MPQPRTFGGHKGQVPPDEFVLPFLTAGSSRPPTGVLGVLRGRSRGVPDGRAPGPGGSGCEWYLFSVHV